MDWISQFIGFLIVVLIIFIPLLRKLLGDMKKVQEKEKREAPIMPPVKKIESVIPTPPHITERKVDQDFAFASELERWEQSSRIDKRKLESKVKPHFKTGVTSSAFRSLPGTAIEQLVEGQKWDKKMVIYSEILAPPVSMR